MSGTQVTNMSGTQGTIASPGIGRDENIFDPFTDYLNLHAMIGTTTGDQLFPQNPSLAGELNRLFEPVSVNHVVERQRFNSTSTVCSSGYMSCSPTSDEESVQAPIDDFRSNGRECEIDDIELYFNSLHLDLESRLPRPWNAVTEDLVKADMLQMRPGQKKQRSPPSTYLTEAPVCVFCRNNGESEQVYRGHFLKDDQKRITCPVLRAYTCPICKASGDDAHTIKYCPLGGETTSAVKALRTPRTSNGKKRIN
ncbi:unnamed protein product [Owenia fusiformis]|uniref:Nanos-type domain-containing protein n=1 Tax=Owenia fusiformis TaxID=6347 RepID=A0A8S4NX44_OWEFU|nr:unnamed protein product [Owenia fusiformis]